MFAEDHKLPVLLKCSRDFSVKDTTK